MESLLELCLSTIYQAYHGPFRWINPLLKFKEWGFIDVFRLHNSETGQYSFWDYTMKNAVKKGMGWRIDHIWATKVIADKSIRAWIDVGPRLLQKPSDHTPVIAEFKIPL